MATRRPPSRPGNQPPKRKEDNFWYVVMVLAIVSFTVSFWIFYAMTSRINTKTPAVAAQPSVEVATPDPNNTVTPTLLIGEGIGSSDALPSPEAFASLAPSLRPILKPSASPSIPGIIALTSAKPSLRPSASARPLPSSSALLELHATPLPMASKAPLTAPSKPPAATTKGEGDTVFRVQVGSYADRDEAAKAAEELAGMGYNVVMIGDGDKTRIQLGAFGDQDKALHLAEEVTQKGFSVVVRRTPR
jgi:cell division septation protein DedD